MIPGAAGLGLGRARTARFRSESEDCADWVTAEWLMKIAAPVHLGRLADRAHSIDDVRSYLDRAGIDRAVCSNLDAAAHGENARDLDELDANLACLEAARIDPRILPLYWV